jgi:hypothetical protein
MTGQPSPPPPVPGPGRVPAPPRRARAGDAVATVILLVVLGVAALVLAFMGLMYAGFYTPYHQPAEWIAAGLLVIGPLAWAVTALVVAILLLVRGRLAFWVPLVAGFLMALTAGLGEALLRLAEGVVG